MHVGLCRLDLELHASIQVSKSRLAKTFLISFNKAELCLSFQGFYIYMFVLSIAFLVYVYTYLLRIRTPPLRRRSRTVVTSVPVNTKRCIPEGSSEEQAGSFYLRLGAVGTFQSHDILMFRGMKLKRSYA